MAKDKLMSYISTASLTSMAPEQTLNGSTGGGGGGGAISTVAGSAGMTPLTPSHSSLSAGNVSMLPNGGIFGGGNLTNGFHHHHNHHHPQQQLPPPPDYGSQVGVASLQSWPIFTIFYVVSLM